MVTCVGGVDGGGRGWGHAWEELTLYPSSLSSISRVFLVKSFAHLISHSAALLAVQIC